MLPSMETNYTANENGSMPTPVAVESNPKPSNQVKLFSVRVTANVQMDLTGEVTVYAVDAEEAADRVRAQIDDEAVDSDIEMEDFNSGYRLSYEDLTHWFDATLEIDERDIEVAETDVDPNDVLQAQVKELQNTISWDAEALTKQKAFLESLIETAVAA